MRLNKNALVTGVNKARSANTSRVFRSGDHIFDRQLVSRQAAGKQLDLVLFDVASEDSDASNPRRTEKQRTKSPVGERTNLHRGFCF